MDDEKSSASARTNEAVDNPGVTKPPERPWWKIAAAIAGGVAKSLVDWLLHHGHPHH